MRPQPEGGPGEVCGGLAQGKSDFGFTFRLQKAANDKMVPDRVGSGVSVLYFCRHCWK
jgi:hypothetical protein